MAQPEQHVARSLGRPEADRAGHTLIAVSLVFTFLKFAGMHWPAFRLFHLGEGMFNPDNVEFGAWIAWGWAAARYLLALASDVPKGTRLGWRVTLTVVIALLPLTLSWYRILYFFALATRGTGIAT